MFFNTFIQIFDSKKNSWTFYFLYHHFSLFWYSIKHHHHHQPRKVKWCICLCLKMATVDLHRNLPYFISRSVCMFNLRESVEASKAVIITVVNCPKNLMVLPVIFSQNLCGIKVIQSKSSSIFFSHKLQLFKCSF